MSVKLKNKIVFLDVNGTIIEYKSFDETNYSQINCQSKKHSHKKRRPVTTLINKVKISKYKELYLLINVNCSADITENKKLLMQYFPFMQDHNMIYIYDNAQISMDIYAKHFGLAEKEIILITSDINYLNDTKQTGCQVYHISSLIK